ncbi:MAG: DUF2179 domain-containing protein [Firmicutes bacterium]|nr:DUF2179 domain-containing protein [Bacillota bacterium]
MDILLMCLKIFFARIIDVSMGSVRTVLMVRGKSLMAGAIAFVEVFLWFIIAREALSSEISSLLIPIFYSGGYATGTLLGTFISSKFLDGLIGVQVITLENNQKMLDEIRKNGFGVSIVDLKKDFEGKKKDMLFIQLHKKSLKILTKIIRKHDPNAFVIINDTKYTQNGLIK